ncbi:Transcription factor (Partial), partial [Seminavis robusta]|eukprot:Sro2137_g316000.1 Transcription factor (661) ;mRNA; r:2-1984
MTESSVYQVKRGTDVGSMSLTDDQLCFKPKNAKDLPETNIAWSAITKHQANPPKNQKAMIKITANDGSTVMFQLKNRTLLDKLVAEITLRLEESNSMNQQQQSSSKPEDDEEKENAPTTNIGGDTTTTYSNVTFNSTTGIVTLSAEKLVYEQEGGKSLTILWAKVDKHQASPPKIAKAMLKVTLASGKNHTFQLPDRKELKKFTEDVDQRIKQYKQNNSNSKPEKSDKEGSSIDDGANGEISEKQVTKSAADETETESDSNKHNDDGIEDEGKQDPGQTTGDSIASKDTAGEDKNSEEHTERRTSGEKSKESSDHNSSTIPSIETKHSLEESTSSDDDHQMDDDSATRQEGNNNSTNDADETDETDDTGVASLTRDPSFDLTETSSAEEEIHLEESDSIDDSDDEDDDGITSPFETAAPQSTDAPSIAALGALIALEPHNPNIDEPDSSDEQDEEPGGASPPEIAANGEAGDAVTEGPEMDIEDLIGPDRRGSEGNLSLADSIDSLSDSDPFLNSFKGRRQSDVDMTGEIVIDDGIDAYTDETDPMLDIGDDLAGDDNIEFDYSDEEMRQGQAATYSQVVFPTDDASLSDSDLSVEMVELARGESFGDASVENFEIEDEFPPDDLRGGFGEASTENFDIVDEIPPDDDYDAILEGDEYLEA